MNYLYFVWQVRVEICATLFWQNEMKTSLCDSLKYYSAHFIKFCDFFSCLQASLVRHAPIIVQILCHQVQGMSFTHPLSHDRGRLFLFHSLLLGTSAEFSSAWSTHRGRINWKQSIVWSPTPAKIELCERYFTFLSAPLLSLLRTREVTDEKPTMARKNTPRITIKGAHDCLSWTFCFELKLGCTIWLLKVLWGKLGSLNESAPSGSSSSSLWPFPSPSSSNSASKETRWGRIEG